MDSPMGLRALKDAVQTPLKMVLLINWDFIGALFVEKRARHEVQRISLALLHNINSKQE